jgi:hypothetical protein
LVFAAFYSLEKELREEVESFGRTLLVLGYCGFHSNWEEGV